MQSDDKKQQSSQNPYDSSNSQQPLKAVGDGLALLSSEGNKQYKELQIQSFKQFSLWFLVANVTGITLSQAIDYLPISSKSKSQRTKHKWAAYIGSLFVFSYHGYKLAKREFIRGKKRILVNPECVIVETDN